MVRVYIAAVYAFGFHHALRFSPRSAAGDAPLVGVRRRRNILFVRTNQEGFPCILSKAQRETTFRKKWAEKCEI